MCCNGLNLNFQDEVSYNNCHIENPAQKIGRCYRLISKRTGLLYARKLMSLLYVY
jgi:hypothetical protein